MSDAFSLIAAHIASRVIVILLRISKPFATETRNYGANPKAR